MHSDEWATAELVEAAAAGDADARDGLIRAYLPLVRDIVARALDGHADVDDVVQDTLLRALDGLTALRDPLRFRSWLVAIAMNQIRRRWRERQNGPVPGLDRAADIADPGADFVDLTILRLGLSGQRREVAEATRWLDEGDRDLLSLWWLEATGELTRADLAEALAVSPQHAAVRVQRMKEQLETGRTVVRALAATPPCPGLAAIVAGWDGRPAPVWRKRFARHLRSCDACAPARSGLAPAEGLLVGLGLVPLLAGDPGAHVPSVAAETAAWTSAPAPEATWPGERWAQTGPAPDATGSGAAGPGSTPWPSPDPWTVPGAAGHAAGGGPGAGAAPGHSGAGRGGGRGSVVRRACAAGAVALGVLGSVILLVPSKPPAQRPVPVPSFAAPAQVATTAPPVPASAPPTPRRTPVPSPSRTRQPGAEERLTGLVNRRRAQEGCAPLRTDRRLTEAARAYANDMVRRGYYAHSSPEGAQADARISAAGYRWSRWAENLARGTADPADVFAGWMDGGGHQANMLDCRYRDTGVAAVRGPDGTVWVQKLAAATS
ncbi:sigma-70 family RNA polymerase sigma factor [Streptomyces sp. NPDC053755]|uniref:sigma-70 family RNA polymerase sigma factor n=1 Tax=Streptomyces sp. NPDC053755 TaxID=3155815 RepID=UPI003414A0D7